MRLFFPPSTVEGREVSKTSVPLKRWNENTWQVPLREKLKVTDFLHCCKKEQCRGPKKAHNSDATPHMKLLKYKGKLTNHIHTDS